MGTVLHNLSSVIMKLIIALSCLLAVASATSEATCEDCQAVVMTLSAYLSAEESVGRQVEVLLAEVCPQAESPEDCVEQLPAFWGRIAMVLWPGYFNPDAEWMCATEDVCGAPGTRGMTCDECLGGIQGAIEQLLSEEFVSGIVEALSGEGFCGMEEDPELCARVIADLIPAALPALAAGLEENQTGEICNMAVPDTCPAH
eukprot:TRINITY_DN3383_c0_g1_i12.p1 TRINITY_DN3383_c0_g1~~TRINITY_DN3383_c0_g1_i12.p1  ORF type:complete len:201 (-),score=77.48 TRINITY_DN3383_c0_g1_i12:8-610(-)